MHMMNYKNLQYTGEVGIGQQYNTFRMVLDTGSANLWVDSTRCQEEGCRRHKQFNAKELFIVMYLVGHRLTRKWESRLRLILVLDP